MNLFARIMSHGFALAVVALIAVGLVYRGELFPDWDLPEFMQLEDAPASRADGVVSRDSLATDKDTVDAGHSAGIVNADAGSTLPIADDTAGDDILPDVNVEQAGVAVDTAELSDSASDAADAVADAAADTGAAADAAEDKTAAIPAVTGAADAMPDGAGDDAAASRTETTGAVEPSVDVDVQQSVADAAGTAETDSPASVDTVGTDAPAADAEDVSAVTTTDTNAPLRSVDHGADQANTVPSGHAPADADGSVDLSAPANDVMADAAADTADAADGGNGDTGAPVAAPPVPSDSQTSLPETPADAPQQAAESGTQGQSAYRLLAAAREAYWLRNYDIARKHYQSLIELEPANPDGYGELGNMYFSQGKWSEASAAYFEAGKRLADEGIHEQAMQLVDVIRGLQGAQGDELEQYVRDRQAN